MTDRQMDLMLRAADPAAGLTALGSSPTIGETGVRLAIPRAAALPRRRIPRPAVAAALAGCAAAAGAVAVVNVVGDGSQPAYGADAVRAAQTAPRLLVGEDGWRVTRADELGVRFGETAFERGAERLQLDWYPAADRPATSPVKGSGTHAVAPTTLDGAPVLIARYDGSDRYRAAWRSGAWTLELDGVAASPERFAALVRSLHAVGVDEWLGAMPASSVRPGNRSEVVDAMLRGVPVPSGFDVAALRAGDGAVRDRYQLGAQVAGTVACAWIGRWVDARAAGDGVAARRAVAAMVTSHRWPVLREMTAQGAYPEAVWQLADAMAANGAAPVGKEGVTVTDAYRSTLGCETRPDGASSGPIPPPTARP